MRVAVPVRARPIAILLLAAIALVACGGPPPPDLSGSHAVTFESRDGVTLEGRLFGDGSTGVVLSHMRPADQRSWFAFANRLADQGYLVLTYDFRGYCPGGEGGCSQGEPQISAIWQDVLGAMDFIRSQGASTVALIGASMGGTASLVAAGQEGTDVAVVVTLSAPESIEGLNADAALLQRVDANKLFIAGLGDASAAASAQDLSEIAPPPKRVEIPPADDHGTDLLTGSQGEAIQRLIETYLAAFAPA
ncbi:MAG TPA: alpha/beta fold hydrolase [Actinomycetota bacterium]|nr:alpha/beta fold hydrolase [Actinomycetota bacterium]